MIDTQLKINNNWIFFVGMTSQQSRNLMNIVKYQEMMNARSFKHTKSQDQIGFEQNKQLARLDEQKSLNNNVSPKIRQIDSIKEFKVGTRMSSHNLLHKSQQSQDQVTLQSFIKTSPTEDPLRKTLEKRIRSIYALEQALQQLIQEKGLSKESEIAKLHKAVNELSNGLERASQSEVELGIKKRELGRNTQDYQDLYHQFQSLKSKYTDEEEMNKRLYKRIDDLQQQNKQNQHNLLIEQRTNSDLQHKIQQLEQRLELVLESDFVGPGTAARNTAESNQEKLRRTLTELVKECEGYKRDIQVKNKEIERISDQLKQAQSRVAKVNQKVENMKKQSTVRDVEHFLDQRKLGEETIGKNDPTTILSRNELYDSLDFRINSLRSEYSDLIHEIQEQGSSAFALKVSQMQNPKQMRENISLITSQYLSFKDNAEKLNTLIKYSLQMLELKTITEQMHFIAQNVKNVFMSERCNLWILDAQNGILYTLNDQNEQVRALMNRGIFAEVIRFQKPVHKREGAIKALYFETQLGKYQVKSPQGALIRANQTLCYPVFNSHKAVAGILEISNSFADYFSFDEEYYGVILAKVAEVIVKQHIHRQLLETNISFNNKFNEAFWDFNTANSLFELYCKARNWFQQILTVQQMAFYFVMGEQLVTFTVDPEKYGQSVKFSWNQGVAGQVRQRKQVINNFSRKALIVMNLRKAFDYDQCVDLDSILPVYVVPIILKATKIEDDDQVLGVVELPLKKRFLLMDAKDKILLSSSTLVGQDERFEFVAKRLCDCLANSFLVHKHLFQQ